MLGTLFCFAENPDLGSSDNPSLVVTPPSENDPMDNPDTLDSSDDEPTIKLPKLFSYLSNSKAVKPSTPASIPLQFNTYLETDDSDEPMQFWSKNRSTLNLLVGLAKRVLAVPASSAPIERVFSHGGIMLRPHRASMSSEVLCKLVFAKCNQLHGLL